jgi:hypothetical protein
MVILSPFKHGTDTWFVTAVVSLRTFPPLGKKQESTRTLHKAIKSLSLLVVIICYHLYAGYLQLHT